MHPNNAASHRQTFAHPEPRPESFDAPTAAHLATSPRPAAASRHSKRKKRQPTTDSGQTAAAVGAVKRNALYGLTGFAIGVVFWHAVGFWSFVSQAVFSGPRDQIQAAVPHQPVSTARPTHNQQTGRIETGSIRQDPSWARNAAQTMRRDPMSPARPLPVTANGKIAGAFNDTPDAEARPLPTGTLNCADLALDRTSGAVSVTGCPDVSSVRGATGTAKAPAASTAAASSWLGTTAVVEAAPRQDRLKDQFVTSVATSRPAPERPSPQPREQPKNVAAPSGWSTAVEPPQLPQW